MAEQYQTPYARRIARRRRRVAMLTLFALGIGIALPVLDQL
jgi:hypothetical protein